MDLTPEGSTLVHHRRIRIRCVHHVTKVLGADEGPQQLIQQRLGLAETQREVTAQQTHQRTEPWTVVTGLHLFHPLRRACGHCPCGAPAA